MVKCPIKSLPEWKELVKAIGENEAYYVWDQNNGYSLDKASDGRPSSAFETILMHFKGDRNEALKVRARMFSNAYKQMYDKDHIPTSTEIVKMHENVDNSFVLDGFDKETLSTVKKTSDLYTSVQKGLKNRINSIKRYTKKNIRLENELNKLITQLANTEVLEGIVEFVDHVKLSINDSIDFLNRPIEEVNAKQIRQLSEDFIGFYKPLIQSIQELVDTTDIFNDIPDVALFKRDLTELGSQLITVDNRFNNLLKNKGSQELIKYLESKGTPQEYIDRMLVWLDSPTNDSSLLSVWFGMSSESDNMIISSIANMLNNVMNTTDRQTFEKGIELVKILNEAKQQHGNDVQKLLCEVLDNGEYSGYLIRDKNYGQFYSNQRQHLDKLATKLGIHKDDSGLYIITDDKSDAWFKGLNDFHAENSNRKYTNEYYELRNKMLSKMTKDKLSEIQDSINQILESITQDGIIYDNLLNPEMYQRLLDLQRSKKLLSISYNLDGSPKTGDDAIIAKELQDFNEEVKIGNEFVPDWARFRKDEAAVIEKYGENSAQHLLWRKRNMRTRNTQEFYDRIRDIQLDRANAKDDKVYQELVDKRRQLLSVYKNPETGLVNLDTLSTYEREMLKQLDQDIANSFEPVSFDDNKDDDKFSNFAEIVFTERYYEDYRAAQAQGSQQFQLWFDSNHYEDYKGVARPASYYTTLRPKEEFLSQYTEEVPANRYSNLDKSSRFFNKKWDPNGPAIQPNDKYDNKKKYNDVMSKPAVKKLYKAILDIITESNQKVSYIANVNNYKLPQVEAKTLQAISRQNGILNKVNYILEDVVTTKADDLDYVDEFATKPNGEPLKIIPTRFIKTLENPNLISTDLVASSLQYFNMASNYQNMSSQRDDIELLLNLLKQAEIHTSKGTKQPGTSNLYLQAQLLVDRIMYGRNKMPLKVKIGDKEYNVGKALDLIRQYITKVNLSYNIWSIGTSFFTDASYTTLEAKVGRFFDTEDLRFATSTFLDQLPEMLAGIGSPIPINKLAFLMQMNQVVKGNKEVFDRLNESKVLRSLNQNFWFMGYTQADYTVKSHTLISTYHNYRLVKGEGFMSKQAYIQKFYPNNPKKGAVMFKQLDTTLWDAYDFSDGEGKVLSKYIKYVTEDLKNQVKNRIDVLSKRIDGTLREVDKSKVHAHTIASYTTQHRNFMIQGIHNRLKGRTFNLDIGMEEEGYYRGMGRFIRGIFSNKHFAVSQILEDYNNLKEFEQYSVKRTVYELMLVSSATVVALSLAAIVDGDDDYNNWLMQSITYLALRSAFEFRTMYNPMELMSMIKSPTAAFSWFDNSFGILGILNPFSYIYAKSPFDLIDRGPYEGVPRILRTISKVTPAKNIIEARDPKSKRNYLQNQLMSF